MRGKSTRKKLGDIRDDRTDWARVDAMTGEKLERAIAADKARPFLDQRLPDPVGGVPEEVGS